MFTKLLVAGCLLAVTVIIHAVGLMAVFRSAMDSPALRDTRFWPGARLLIGTAAGIILCHLVEIVVWALFYWWQQCLPDLESSVYFSGVTYATVGYGDLVLSKEWRLLASVEALTGILMCGWSTGIFFVVVNVMQKARIKEGTTSVP